VIEISMRLRRNAQSPSTFAVLFGEFSNRQATIA
jgi:hypothetical protein